MVASASQLDRSLDTPVGQLDPHLPEQDLLFSRAQMVSRILELNPTTSVSFLNDFSDESLGHYLARLHTLQQPRPAPVGWVRTSETPAIVCREPVD